MHIYFKAPLKNNDLYITHLCEHLIAEYFGETDYFNLRYDLNATSFPGYCIFDLPNWITKEAILEVLNNVKFINLKKYINGEEKVIAEELEDPEYDKRIYEATINTDNKTIKYKHNTNKNKWDISEISEYFNNLVNENNYIISDDKFNIIYEGFKNSKNEDLELIINKTEFNFEDDEYTIYSFGNISNETIGKLITGYEILNAYNKGKQRIENKEYYYLTPYIYEFIPTKKIIFVIPKIDYKGINESFFNQGKEFTTKAIKNGEYNEKLKIIYPYFLDINYNEEKIIESIKNYSFKEFKNMF